MSFIARHDLWNDDQRRAAEELSRRIEAERIELVRLSFPDLHGLLRGKALLASALPGALQDGCTVTSTLLLKDTAPTSDFAERQLGGAQVLCEMYAYAGISIVQAAFCPIANRYRVGARRCSRHSQSEVRFLSKQTLDFRTPCCFPGRAVVSDGGDRSSVKNRR